MFFFSIALTLPCFTALRRSSLDKDLRSLISATFSPVSAPRFVSKVSPEDSSEDSDEDSEEVSSALEVASKETRSRYCCAALSSMFSEGRSTFLLDIIAATQTEPIVAKPIAAARIRLILAGFSDAVQNLSKKPCFSLVAFFCKILLLFKNTNIHDNNALVIMVSQVYPTPHTDHILGQNTVFYVAIGYLSHVALGYSLQRSLYGASSSSISGKRPTGGLNLLSVLSSFTCETSPKRTAPVPFSTSKS